MARSILDPRRIVTNTHCEDLGRKLEKRMNLKARATAQRIFDGNAPRADITSRACLQGFAADLTARLPLAQQAQQ